MFVVTADLDAARERKGRDWEGFTDTTVGLRQKVNPCSVMN